MPAPRFLPKDLITPRQFAVLTCFSVFKVLGLVLVAYALGTWIASFHAQGSFPLDPETRQTLDRPNSENCDFRHSLNQKGILRVIANSPHVFEGVEDEFKGYLQEKLDSEVEGAMCVAHGDFSVRK